MSLSDSNRPAPPPTRDLKSPYFLSRTPDGLGSYFTAENFPIVASPHEPLSRFLAPARLVEAGTLRSIRYEFGPGVAETARPMEFLPQSEIDAFAVAVLAFYARAHAFAPRVVPHEKGLRAHFRLPDPDLEPDAYWVYGPAHDRRLLILWGAERQAGTSLPLAPDVELKISAGRTILEKLQSRVMGWPIRQREALRFALDPAEPISRFLARPAVDQAGKPAGVSCQGATIAGKKLRPLRRVYTRECAAFERAARAFYDRGQRKESTAYEKEIRQAFRLPDPDLVAGAYFLAGRRPIILLDGRETRDSTLPLIDHPLVPVTPGLPGQTSAPSGADYRVGKSDVALRGLSRRSEAKTESAGIRSFHENEIATDGPVVIDPKPVSPGATVAEKLRARSISSALVTSLAAAAAIAILAVGFAVWRLAPDHTAPRVVESADFPAAVDASHVAVKFSKSIDPRSIQLGAAGPVSFAFGDDAARIESAKTDVQDPSRVLLVTTPLTDGRTYHLTVDRLSDRTGNPLAEATSVSFKYLDTRPPEITAVSAGENANQLILVFSKPVSESSVARGGNYALFALEAGGEGAAQRIASGRLDPEDKTGRTVVLEAVRDFVGNQPYRLDSIAGVTDASVSKNPVALPAKGLDFPYRDVLPPRIRSLTASSGKLELTVTFSKPVDPAAATNLGNYAAAGPKKEELNFLPGSAALDATGRNVTLRLLPAPLDLGIYHLTVREMSDRMGNRTAAPLAASFEFADADRSALEVSSHSIVTADNQVDNKVTLTFNRALNADDAIRAGNYTLLGADRTPLDLTVAEARRVPDDPAQVLLILSQPPTPGVRITVRIAGVADIFGRKPAAPLEYAFTPPGVPGPSEQVLGWEARPVLRGNELALAIREAVARPSALATQNYVFNASGASVRGVTGYEVKTDAKTGLRSTLLTLRVDVPPAVRAGLTLRVRDLRAEGLDFLGAQKLKPVEVAEP